MEKQKVKKVLCPVCGTGQIVAVSHRTDASQWRLFRPEDAEEAELFLKCQACKKQIGLAHK